ncbi:MAG: hypothetical protein FJ106_01155 [Deltaproteobacteria bacterium]|nr:hypothetical protein [Deltaproteobacteria bacterium]
MVELTLTFVVDEARIDTRLSKLEARVHSYRNSSIGLPASIPASSPLNDFSLIRNACLREVASAKAGAS